MKEMIPQFAILTTALFLLLPWFLLALVIFRERAFLERTVLGLVGGLAVTVTAGYVLAMLHWLEWYLHFHLLVLMVAVVSVIAYRRTLIPVPAAVTEGRPGQSPRSRLWFGLAMGLIILAEAVPTFSTDVPIGWDPSFHSILAQKVLESGALAVDWRPFEEIAVNYPLGTHVIIAIISKLAGTEVHQTFQTLHLVIQVLAAALIYLLAFLIFEDSRTAVLAMLSYALLCEWGSFTSYYQWGGLPTEIGSIFFLAIIWSCMAAGDTKHTALRVLLLGSLILVHHLSAVIACSVMVFYICLIIMNRKLDDLSRRFAQLLVLTLASYSFFIVPYVVKSGDIAGTHVLRFYDEGIITLDMIFGHLGYVVSVCGLAGLFLSTSRKERPRQVFLLCWLTSLVLCFCALDYIYRLAANLMLHENFTAFTPSRFLTVISYPLAMYSGHALGSLVTAAEGLARRVLHGGWAGQAADAMLAALLLMMTILAVPDIRYLASLRGFDPGTRALGSWIRESTPENAFIIYQTPVDAIEWMPYLTWRPSVSTPIPASENRQVIEEKLTVFGSGFDLPKIKAWLDRRGLRGYLLLRGDDASLALREI